MKKPSASFTAFFVSWGLKEGAETAPRSGSGVVTEVLPQAAVSTATGSKTIPFAKRDRANDH